MNPILLAFLGSAASSLGNSLFSKGDQKGGGYQSPVWSQFGRQAGMIGLDHFMGSSKPKPGMGSAAQQDPSQQPLDFAF